ncbi:aminotransferase class I/II-fold pyridoxal phosphate-dependent enzyme [Alkalithermobacter paradoxus]|uniref:Arginine decarboxylase n=1 Tax=Alkalithermobacter paradoxus TaxID=29349 RepID=A0A1V4I5B0_9FIRM|nr:arginine decarboxylase [[Clostridium] thermoalcaliphilum]
MKRLDQTMTPLFTALKDYHSKNVIPFDVPGHKHGVGLRELADFIGDRVLEVDVNSMKCLDNLSNPIGVIAEAEELAADAYWADYAYFMVNGTTAAVQAMIMSVCEPGDKIILPRNAHKSATSAIILSGAIPVYIQPEINEELGIAMGVSIQEIERAIGKHPDAKAIFLINPTYYGAISDLAGIVKIAHRNGIAVLVDEAHGAHMHFHPELPESAMSVGADMAAVSMHKTGGSLTQSSVLLVRDGIVDAKQVRTTINLTQTTSASYLLMTSLDVARKQLATNGQEMIENVLTLVRDARDKINKIDGLYAFGKELIDTPGVYDFDETKLGINVRKLGLTGYEVYDILRDEYNIQMELGDNYNVLAIVSLGDTKENLDKLVDALYDISIKHRRDEEIKLKKSILKNPDLIVAPRDAFYSTKHSILLEDAVGEISGESVMVYPLGIPIIVPGEKITKDIVEYIKFLKEEEVVLQGTQDPYVDYINVLGIE